MASDSCTVSNTSTSSGSAFGCVFMAPPSMMIIMSENAAAFRLRVAGSARQEEHFQNQRADHQNRAYGRVVLAMPQIKLRRKMLKASACAKFAAIRSQPRQQPGNSTGVGSICWKSRAQIVFLSFDYRNINENKHRQSADPDPYIARRDDKAHRDQHRAEIQRISCVSIRAGSGQFGVLANMPRSQGAENDSDR